MPHFALEYSANLEGRVDMKRLCERIYEAAAGTGIFPLAGIRVRTHKCDHHVTADQHPENAFIHITFSVGSGRTEEARTGAGETVWEALNDFLKVELSKPYFALSMEMRQIDPVTTWKRNAIAPRMDKQKN